MDVPPPGDDAIRGIGGTGDHRRPRGMHAPVMLKARRCHADDPSASGREESM